MKYLDPRPDIYKIVFQAGRWTSKSERYYTAFTSQEAMMDFYHTFVVGHVHAKTVKVYRIERYDRFSDTWDNHIQSCLDDLPKPVLTNVKVKDNRIIFHEI